MGVEHGGREGGSRRIERGERERGEEAKNARRDNERLLCKGSTVGSRKSSRPPALQALRREGRGRGKIGQLLISSRVRTAQAHEEM